MDITLPEGMKLHVKHLFPENSSRKQRHGSKYLTVAKVVKKDSQDNEVIMSVGYAKCNRGDVPRRKMGYSIAVGRALAKINP